MPVRRVVTGEVDGRTVVVSDSSVDAVTISLMPGDEFLRIWSADAVPTLPNDGAEPRRGLLPTLSGYRFDLITIAPDAETAAVRAIST